MGNFLDGRFCPGVGSGRVCEVFAAPFFLSFISWGSETRHAGEPWGADGDDRRRPDMVGRGGERCRAVRGALPPCVCLPGSGDTQGCRGGSRMDGGAPWWPGGAAGSRPARDGAGSRVGVSRWLPSLLVRLPGWGDTQGCRGRGRERVTRAAGLGHVGVGSPASPWLLGSRGRAPSP